MKRAVTVIGVGEAAQALAAPGWRAFDIADKRRAAAALGLVWCATNRAAVAGAAIVLSLVTADQALAAAQDSAASLAAGALYIDLNSVAPQTKRAAAAMIAKAGGRYVDAAVMAPVDPAGRQVPVLTSGPDGDDGAAALVELGFGKVRSVGGEVGRAAAIKLTRSIMVKGIEALTAEMMAAANAADVSDEVLASLGPEWVTKARYNIERMEVHGLRRAAEMEQAAIMLESLGIAPVMTTGTVRLQREWAGTSPTVKVDA